MSDDKHPVGIEDGLTDQQRRGAELAAAGWSSVDIAAKLGIRQETVSRWRKLPQWQAAHDAIVSEIRGELQASLHELAGKALAELEELVEYRHDPGIRLRAAISLLQQAGIGKVQSRSGAGRFGAAAAGGTEHDDYADALTRHSTQRLQKMDARTDRPSARREQ